MERKGAAMNMALEKLLAVGREEGREERKNFLTTDLYMIIYSYINLLLLF